MTLALTQVRNHGEMYLPYAVLLGGLTCIAFALLRCANLLVLISSSVMIGFVNGLAIIISLSQVSQFKANLLDGIPGREADGAGTPAPPTGRRLHGAIDVFTDGEPWLGWDVAQWMLLEVIVVIVAMVSFPMLAGYDKLSWTKNIPPSLVGIMLATAVEWGIVRPAGYETRTVGDIGQMNGSLPKSMWSQPYDLPPLNGETFGIVAPTGFALAGVALIEQLMTQELVDDLTKTGSSKHRESFGLGIGNVVVGLLGGMGGNAMIAHSLIQVRTGGTHRLSNIAVGVTVMIISAAAYPFVNLMPQAAFVGMMWVIVYYTFEWKSLPIVWHAFTGMQVRAGWLTPFPSSSASAAAFTLLTEAKHFLRLRLRQDRFTSLSVWRLGKQLRPGWMASVGQMAWRDSDGLRKPLRSLLWIGDHCGQCTQSRGGAHHHPVNLCG